MARIYIATIIVLIVLNVLLLCCLLLRFKKRKTQKQRRFNIIKFSKSIVITIFLLLISYVITVLIIFIVTGNEPAVLTENLFGFFKAEGGFLAIIKVAEGAAERLFKRKHEHKSNVNNEEEPEHDY